MVEAPHFIIFFKKVANLLEICYFYILQTNSNLNKIFHKIMNIYIIYMFFFINLDNFFVIARMGFYKDRGFYLISHIHYIKTEGPCQKKRLKLN